MPGGWDLGGGGVSVDGQDLAEVGLVGWRVGGELGEVIGVVGVAYGGVDLEPPGGIVCALGVAPTLEGVTHRPGT